MANLNGMDQAKVVAALYNASRAQGMGFMQYDATPMSVEEARELLQHTPNFDYLKGRVMKLSFKNDELDTRLYNRDNGEGAAELVIDSIRASDDVNNQLVQRIHELGLDSAIRKVREHLGDQSTISDNVVSLGLDDVRHFLEPKVNQAEEGLEDRRMAR